MTNKSQSSNIDSSSTIEANTTAINNEIQTLSSDSSNTIQLAKGLASIIKDNSNSYKISSKKLTIKGYKGNLDVDYPCFEGNNSNLKHLNDAILKTLNSNILKEDENMIIDTSIDYEIKTMTDRLVSILFTGISNSRTAAHPLNISFTINYDLKNNRILLLEDITEVNANFLDKSKTTMKNQLDIGVYEAIISTNKGNEKLLEILKSDKAQFYFNNGKLYLGFTVPVGSEYTTFINFNFQ